MSMMKTQKRLFALTFLFVVFVIFFFSEITTASDNNFFARITQDRTKLQVIHELPLQKNQVLSSIFHKSYFTFPQVMVIGYRNNTNDNIDTIDTIDTTTFSENDLTPQERQKMQAIRQRRNRDILAILDDVQKQELARNLHQGINFQTALSELNLSPQQTDLIEAIFDFTNLKIKGIFSRHSLLEYSRQKLNLELTVILS